MNSINEIIIMKEREGLVEMVELTLEKGKNLVEMNNIWRQSYDIYTKSFGEGLDLDNQDYYIFAIKRLQYQREKVMEYLNK